MHESPVSTSLGMRGFPHMSESIMLARDIKLLEYTASKLHAYAISCSESVEMIKAALKDKLSISASVPAHNLYLTDDDLIDFGRDLYRNVTMNDVIKDFLRISI